MRTLGFTLLLVLFTVPAIAQTSDVATDADREAVRQAALNYVNALYYADSTLVVESVDPRLKKYGYYYREGEGYSEGIMTYDELTSLATRWNADARRFDPDGHPKSVTVFEVLDKTASAKVTAEWGSDYLLLAKLDGEWKIRQILWQSPPPQMAAADE